MLYFFNLSKNLLNLILTFNLSIKELGLEVKLSTFLCIFRCFSTTKEAPFDIPCSLTLDFCKYHFLLEPEFVVAGENDNGVLQGQ